MLVIVRIFSTSKTKLGVEVQCQERKRLQPLIQRSGRVFNARLEKAKTLITPGLEPGTLSETLLTYM